MNKTILISGAITGMVAVLLGAFAAHGLEKIVDNNSISSFTTGVRYQMYHAIVCLILGNMAFIPKKTQKLIFYFFISGMLLFSGSIYLLVLDDILGISLSFLGFITPLGGVLLIIGWALMITSLAKIK